MGSGRGLFTAIYISMTDQTRHHFANMLRNRKIGTGDHRSLKTTLNNIQTDVCILQQLFNEAIDDSTHSITIMDKESIESIATKMTTLAQTTEPTLSQQSKYFFNTLICFLFYKLLVKMFFFL